MNSNFFQKLHAAISPDRLNAYRQDKAGEAVTIARYLWNSALCETLYSPLQMCEIGLRNAINQALSQHFMSEAWYDNCPGRLSQWASGQIDAAKERLSERNKPLNSPFRKCRGHPARESRGLPGRVYLCFRGQDALDTRGLEARDTKCDFLNGLLTPAGW